MQSSEIYILLFNQTPLFTSMNLTVLWSSIKNRCAADGQEAPDPYYTARRRLLAENKYTHQAAPGYVYTIRPLQMLKKPVQYKAQLFNDNAAS